MRIYQNDQQLVQAAHVQAKRLDISLVEVLATGLDEKGELVTFRLLLGIREVSRIADAAR